MENRNKFKGKYRKVFERIGRIQNKAEHLDKNSYQMSKIEDSQLPLINRHPSMYLNRDKERQEICINNNFGGYDAITWAKALIEYKKGSETFVPEDQEKTLSEDPCFSKLVRIIEKTGDDRPNGIGKLVAPLMRKFIDRSLTELEYNGILNDTSEDMQKINEYSESYIARETAERESRRKARRKRLEENKDTSKETAVGTHYSPGEMFHLNMAVLREETLHKLTKMNIKRALGKDYEN